MLAVLNTLNTASLYVKHTSQFEFVLIPESWTKNLTFRDTSNGGVFLFMGLNHFQSFTMLVITLKAYSTI